MAKKSNVNIPAIQIIRLIVFLFLGLILFSIYSKTNEFLTSSELFRVHDVVIDPSIRFIDVSELRRLKGRNIFSVDITKLQARIKAQYPQISDLQVMRDLPDRIRVLAKKRDALFQTPVKGRVLLVDADGVAMYYVNEPVDVPVVRGALPAPAKVVLGAPLAAKPVVVATGIMRGFRSHPRTASLKVASVDVENLSKITVLLASGMKVILDGDNYTRKLDVLEMMMAQKKVDFTQVKYVDLRFTEPVLGENNENPG